MSDKEETMHAIASRQRIGGLMFRFIPVAGIVVAASAYIFAGTARANYGVIECHVNQPANFNLYMERPFPASSFKIAQSDTCGGWGLRMEANGQSNNGTWVAWRIDAPGGTIFRQAQTTLHYYTNGGYGPMAEGGGSPGYTSVGPAGDQWVTPVQNNTAYYRIREQCFGSPCSSTSAFAYITNFYADVQDLSAPSVSASGELLGGGTVSGVQTINAAVSDYGGGIRSIVVYVNGLASGGTGDMCPPRPDSLYVSVKPCSDSSGSRAIQLDTEHGSGWVNGANDVRICGYDVAGNQSPCIKKTVQVDNSCPGSGGKVATKLDAGADIGGQLVRRATLTSNDEPVIRGSLTDNAGQPVEGATVCVYQTTNLPDAGREPVTRVTTQANGRFATRLDAGASRTVDLAYRYNTARLSDRVELDSTVVPVFKIPRSKRHLHDGQATRFKGWLPGPNADGRAVALQARTGKKWRTFKQLRTDPEGHFRGKYRFLHTSGRQRYLFRVLVKSQGGYPYEPGASRKRKVIVRG